MVEMIRFVKPSLILTTGISVVGCESSSHHVQGNEMCPDKIVRLFTLRGSLSNV